MSDTPKEWLEPELEQHARRLLLAAADTIPVDPAPPVSGLPPRRRPTWAIAAAAAAVVLLIGLVTVLARHGDGTAPSPAPRPGTAAVPQMLMMTSRQASSTLRGLGLVAVIRPADVGECPWLHGRVLGSRPAPTSVVPPGSRITVQVGGTRGPDDETTSPLCSASPRHFDDALALLDLARFGEGGPTFAPSVAVWFNGVLTTTLDADQATDPSAWGKPSPLTALTDAVDDVIRVNDRLQSPTIWTRVDHDDQYACGSGDPPPALAGRPSTLVTVDHPTDGGLLAGCHWFRVYHDALGRVDAVAAAVFPWPPPQHDAERADTPGEPTAAQQAVAESFTAFARGGPPPAFAPVVQLRLGNEVVASLTADQAADPGAWAVPCDSYAERSCPIDALSALAGTRRPAVTRTVVREPSACYALRGGLPSTLTDHDALTRSVSLSVPEPQICADNWELQLWFDDTSAVYAVNLELGSP